MNKFITYDDVLILPQFSDINSRKDVNIFTEFKNGVKMALPVFSSNMETITGVKMALAMSEAGGAAVHHRFQKDFTSVQEEFFQSPKDSWWSFGLGQKELERVEYLVKNLGKDQFCLDVAHGAQQQVLDQVNKVLLKYPDIKLMVGNFATPETIRQFSSKVVLNLGNQIIYKVGIGPSSVCSTRLKTGVGVPQLSAVLECAKTGLDIVADGGIKTPGDVSKALAAGAKAVMCGSILAGTDETPGEIIYPESDSEGKSQPMKRFHGSAWKLQPEKGHRTSEGEFMHVPAKGPVSNVLMDIEGGLRSAMTYVGARTLTEFQERAKFIEVSNNVVIENSIRKL